MRPDSWRAHPTAWVRLAIALWTIVVLVVCVRSVVEPRRRSLFPTYAAAGADWRAGANLYLHTLERPEAHIDLFRYSPFAAALLVPWSLLPEGLGGALWRLSETAVYLGGALWWIRSGLPNRLNTRQMGVLFVLLLPLALPSLGNGQANLFVIGLLLGAVTAAAEERWGLTASCLALATALKLYPLAIALLLLVCYPRRLVVPLLLTLLAVAGLPFLLQHPDYVGRQYLSWQHILSQDVDRRSLPTPMTYRDLWLLCRVCGVPMSNLAYEVVRLTLAGACALVCLGGQRQGQPHRRTLTTILTLGCGWLMLCGPSVESSTFVLLGPALAWTLLDPETPLALFWSACGSAALLGCCLLAGLVPRTTHIHALGLHPLASLLFFAAALVQAAVQARVRPGPAPGQVAATARAA
jgi:hypothetical protein